MHLNVFYTGAFVLGAYVLREFCPTGFMSTGAFPRLPSKQHRFDVQRRENNGNNSIQSQLILVVVRGLHQECHVTQKRNANNGQSRVQGKEC